MAPARQLPFDDIDRALSNPHVRKETLAQLLTGDAEAVEVQFLTAES